MKVRTYSRCKYIYIYIDLKDFEIQCRQKLSIENNQVLL